MPALPHCSAIRSQHARSAAVIVVVGSKQAIVGAANGNNASANTPSLVADFTASSLRVVLP